MKSAKITFENGMSMEFKIEGISFVEIKDDIESPPIVSDELVTVGEIPETVTLAEEELPQTPTVTAETPIPEVSEEPKGESATSEEIPETAEETPKDEPLPNSPTAEEELPEIIPESSIPEVSAEPEEESTSVDEIIEMLYNDDSEPAEPAKEIVLETPADTEQAVIDEPVTAVEEIVLESVPEKESETPEAQPVEESKPKEKADPVSVDFVGA